MVDPIRRAVRVRRAGGTESLLTEQDELDGEDLLPGFRLSVARLFA
jgi:Uma2 family endonuclease